MSQMIDLSRAERCDFLTGRSAEAGFGRGAFRLEMGEAIS
jgi:hypothetical protein